MSSEFFINGLNIPPFIIRHIHNGTWNAIHDHEVVGSLFKDRDLIDLYSIEDIVRENKSWTENVDPIFIGNENPSHFPGTIDPRLSILIGDLGLGYDQPIALDFRPSLLHPSVVVFYWADYGNANYWIEIATTVEDFAKKLKII